MRSERAHWNDIAKERLLEMGAGSPGWGYQPSTSPAVEPTSLAALGLLASGCERSGSRGLRRARAAATWMISLQRTDGSLGVSAELGLPGWATPYALLLWAALGAFSSQRQRAVRWLLGQRGTTKSGLADGVIGHDTTLAGWPWVSGTHSWLEPTAVSVMALRREGFGRHPRVLEGIQLIRDRAIAEGGWNYGNSVVFGKTLRPQPGPTGLALLALAGVDGAGASAAPAVQYLQTALPEIRSPLSLAWGLLGLRAWQADVPEAENWLAEAAGPALAAQADSSLGLLLLAAGRKSLELLGIPMAPVVRKRALPERALAVPEAPRGGEHGR
ncbi:MAG TPA: hypothetical protein VGY53_08205 [Isosphaeraceae bacterium]|nr:hypothetical protein [Isosphaeraceae bacterium]